MKTLTNLLADVRAYLEGYVTFPNPDYSLIAALWAVGTYLWQSVDAYPYLVITAATKRSGKTRFAELLGFLSRNPFAVAGVTAPTVFRAIKSKEPTLIIDEAESLSGEGADVMRAVLNVGHRKGQSIPRTNGRGEIEQWPAYCPKVFVLIGDVRDTLRDRSIVLTMRRGEPQRRFTFDVAMAEGAALAGKLKEWAKAHHAEIVDRYERHTGLDFLNDRDEEMWVPLFAICDVLQPDLVGYLKRVAVDAATEKTAVARRHVDLKMAEADLEEEEYSERLLHDLVTVLNGDREIFTAEALARLLALDTGPWRKFRGVGLTPIDMGNLLGKHGVRPKPVRRGKQVARGYRGADVRKAAEKL